MAQGPHKSAAKGLSAGILAILPIALLLGSVWFLDRVLAVAPLYVFCVPCLLAAWMSLLSMVLRWRDPQAALLFATTLCLFFYTLIRMGLAAAWLPWPGAMQTVALYLLLAAVPLGAAGAICLWPVFARARRCSEAEAALAESREKQQHLIAAATEMTYEADPSGRLLSANAAAARFFGMPEHELQGTNYFDLIPEEAAGRIRDALERQRSGDITAFYHEFPLVDQKGRTRWAGESVRALAGRGVITGFQGVLRDVSARKASDTHRVRLATAIEQAAEAFIVTDPSGVIEYVNPAFERITGHPAAETAGSSIRILQEDTGRGGIYDDVLARLAQGDRWQGRATALHKGGTTVQVEMTVSPIREGDRTTHYLFLQRDVSETRHLEAQLRQAQKMEAIGTLAGGIAHDFNNILSAIMGYTDLAMADVPAGTQTHEFLQEVWKAGSRATDLVKQILTFSRRREEPLGPLRLEPVVREALKLLRGSLPATIEISTDMGDDLPAVLADPAEIHQVVMNLCTNACHAMGEAGGTLTVRVFEVSIDARHARRQRDLRPGRYVQVSVRDTGHGMERETMERMFEPFFTTKQAGEGTGLGLATVHGIVKRHKGTVEVDSAAGKGTEFRVMIPACEGTAVEDGGADEHTPAEGHESILFVDDEKQIVDSCVLALERLGYRVKGCLSGVEALSLFSSHADEFDIAIVDQSMPRMTGVELARRLHERRADIPIVLCCGITPISEDTLADTPHIRVSIAKPLVPRELARTVRRVFDDRTAPGRD